MRLKKIMPALFAGLLMTFIFISVSTVRSAENEDHEIIFSKRYGFRILATLDEKGKWCREDLGLKMILQDDSPLHQGGIKDIFPKLKPVFETDCPKAKTAKVSVFKGDSETAFGDVYTIASVVGWAVASQASLVVVASAPDAPTDNHVEDEAKKLAAEAVVGTEKKKEAARIEAAKKKIAEKKAAEIEAAKKMAAQKDAAEKEAAKKKNERKLVKLNRRDLLLYYIKSMPFLIEDVNFQKYMASTFECKKYKNIAQNELKIDSYLKDFTARYVEILKEGTPRFTYNMVGTLGKYDTKVGGFSNFYPLAGISPIKMFTIPPGSWDECRNLGRRNGPSVIEGYFKQTKLFNGVLELEEEIASELLSRNARVRRSYYMQLVFDPVKAPVSANIAKAFVNYKLIEASVYSDKGFTQLIKHYDTEMLGGLVQKRIEWEAYELAVNQYENKKKTWAKGQGFYNKIKETNLKDKLFYLHNKEEMLRGRWQPVYKPRNLAGTALISYLTAKPQKITNYVRIASINKKDKTAKVDWPFPATLKLKNVGDVDKGMYFITGSVMPNKTEIIEGVGPVAFVDVSKVTGCSTKKCKALKDPKKFVRSLLNMPDWDPDKPPQIPEKPE